MTLIATRREKKAHSRHDVLHTSAVGQGSAIVGHCVWECVASEGEHNFLRIIITECCSYPKQFAVCPGHGYSLAIVMERNCTIRAMPDTYRNLASCCIGSNICPVPMCDLGTSCRVAFVFRLGENEVLVAKASEHVSASYNFWLYCTNRTFLALIAVRIAFLKIDATPELWLGRDPQLCVLLGKILLGAW